MGSESNNTMTKADLARAIHDLGVFNKKQSAELVELVFNTLKQRLESGERVKISGFGNFEVRDKDARPGRNPHTGDDLTIEARRVLRFKPSQKLKDQLNATPVSEDELAEIRE